MGNWKYRLLRKHNLGKLVLGQFLLIFAILILDPYPVHEVFSWDVMDPYDGIFFRTSDEFKAGTNPLNGTAETYDGTIWIGNDTNIWVVQANLTVVNASSSGNDTWPPYYSFLHDYYSPSPPPKEQSTWVDIGSVGLVPRNYNVWVLIPVGDDGEANYKVFTEDDTEIEVVEAGTEVTREYGRHTFYLDCSFTISERGTYHLEANRGALRHSYLMLVVPEKSWAYPFIVAIGWLLILQVVTVKGYEFVKGRIERRRMVGRQVERYVFPPDVAYFFAMGPEPAWKGGAFFMFPRGTTDFLAWEPMNLEFPKGTDRFFDREPGPD